MWLIRSSFFFKFLQKKKRKKKVSCYEDKVFTSNNWMSVLANMGKYHNDKCMHLSKEWKSRNMIIVSIQKKNDNVWLSILKTFCAVVISKGQLVVPDTVFYFQNHRSLRQLQSKSWRDNIRLQFFFFFFFIGTSG